MDGIVMQIITQLEPTPFGQVETIKMLDGRPPTWTDALFGVVALLEETRELMFAKAGGSSLAAERLRAMSEALQAVSMAQWCADLATPAGKRAEAVLDWRECHPEATPCCARLENARAWAQGG